MDKDIIKNHLQTTFLSEEAKHKGLKSTEDVQKESGKTNKDAMKDVEKEMKDYDNAPKKDKDAIEPPKHEKTKDEEDYHDEVETLNGQEMLDYDNEPSDRFKERAEKAIVGDPMMGNGPGANAEATWGASNDDFGKELVDRVKGRKKKADAEAVDIESMGDDIELTGKKGKGKNLALAESEVKEDAVTEDEVSEDEVSEDANSILHKTHMKGDSPDELFHKDVYEQKEEKMKRLVFKEEFNGVENALKKIPNKYKVDGKSFQMTDGNEKYEIKWEGSLNEGRAIIVSASDKNLMNESLQQMKHLMNYNSKETLGNLKGEQRIVENESFGTIWDKTKNLINENKDKTQE